MSDYIEQNYRFMKDALEAMTQKTPLLDNHCQRLARRTLRLVKQGERMAEK